MSLSGFANAAPIELASFDGKHFRFVCGSAFAPGQPLRVELAFTENTLLLELKSLGSVRRSDGRFDVRARATTLTREAREQLAAALSR